MESRNAAAAPAARNDIVRRPRGAAAALGLPLLATLALLLGAPASPVRSAQRGAADPGYRYYLAAVAAADARLQLHDTVAARRWLDEAPAAHRGWEWRYLDALADRSGGAFAAHEGTVTDMSVSPDGALLATTGGNEIALWSVADGTRVATLSGHTASTWNARFSPDGDRIASVSSDGTLRIWDREGFARLLEVGDIGAGVSGVAWHPDGDRVATVSWKFTQERGVWGVVDAWDAATGASIQHLDHGIKPIASVTWAPDGSRLYVGTWDFDVGVYETTDWRRVAHLIPPEDDIYKAVREHALSPDGALIAIAHEDGALRIWDTASGELLRVLQRQSEGAHWPQNDVEWLPDGRRIAAVSSDYTVRIWDAVTGDHLAALHGHTSKIESIAITPDGSTLFSGDTSGEVRRWDLSELDPARRRWPLPDFGYSAAISHDGSRVASTGWTGWAIIVEAASGRELARWQAHGTSGVRAAWSPSDDLLATTGNDGMVKVWDVAGAEPELRLEREVEVQSLGVAFSPDGRYLASPSTGPVLRVWSVPDGADAATLDEGVSFSGVVWHPSGDYLAASGQDGVVRLWDPRRSHVIATLPDHGRGMLAAAFSADGTRLAVASVSGAVRVWDPGSFALLQQMSVTNGGQLAVAFSPDGSRLATGGQDSSLHVWDPATGAQLITVPFSAHLWEIGWSPDGTRLVTIPLDGTIRVLEAPAR